jgi:hypothetical protein
MSTKVIVAIIALALPRWAQAIAIATTSTTYKFAQYCILQFDEPPGRQWSTAEHSVAIRAEMNRQVWTRQLRFRRRGSRGRTKPLPRL